MTAGEDLAGLFRLANVVEWSANLLTQASDGIVTSRTFPGPRQNGHRATPRTFRVTFENVSKGAYRVLRRQWLAHRNGTGFDVELPRVGETVRVTHSRPPRVRFAGALGTIEVELIETLA